MGLPNKDVDDGLTLMYLIGNSNIDLLGVTTTFGNSHIEDVFGATTKLFDDLNLAISLSKKEPGKVLIEKVKQHLFLLILSINILMKSLYWLPVL